jgi:hypothetical protein
MGISKDFIFCNFYLFFLFFTEVKKAIHGGGGGGVAWGAKKSSVAHEAHVRHRNV